MKKILYIALVALCAACTPLEPTKSYITGEEADALIEKGEFLTIEQFKEKFMTEKGNYWSDTSQYRSRATKDGINFLFSIDTIPVSETPIYIRGRVTTDDYAGNFYKTLCIQQMVDGKQQALRISVDAGSVGGLYQLGQEILIRVDGLAIGRYANQPQLCVPSYNNNIYADKAEQKVGWAPGRIPIAIFKAHTICIGTPDVSKLRYDTLNINDFNTILNIQEARSLDGKLVRVTNVHFTGEYNNYGKLTPCTLGDPETDKYANVFAPTTRNWGHPQSRVIADANGDWTLVSSSEYAKFAHFYLPGADKNGVSNCSNFTGTVTGILGFYNDNAKYDPEAYDWSITIRSLDDLDLRDANDNLWPRIEYSK